MSLLEVKGRGARCFLLPSSVHSLTVHFHDYLDLNLLGT